MTTTQYIGARYVPLFATPLDWDSTQAYDALTIVYYAGNSYTSRQAVPAGIQITNEDYWALTGNYNAQIEQYRAEVKAYDERITTADTTANNALSLAQTNEKDIATLDSEMAGTAESGLKTLISTSVATETSRAEGKESELADSISAEQTRATNKESELTASISAEQTRAESKESELNTAITNEVSRATNLEATLQSEVNTNAESITALRKTVDGKHLNEFYNIVCIGDSYAQAPTETYTWVYHLKKLFPNSNFYNYAVWGTGFNAGSTTFNAQINNAKNGVPDVNAITHVIIGGARNDTYNSYDSYKPTVNTALSNARSSFPNARIIVVPMLWDSTVMPEVGYQKAATIQLSANELGCSCINGAWVWGKGETEYYQSGNIHPNETGAMSMAAYIADAIRGCYCNKLEYNSYSFGSATVNMYANNGIATMTISGDSDTTTSINVPLRWCPMSSVAVMCSTKHGSSSAPLIITGEDDVTTSTSTRIYFYNTTDAGVVSGSASWLL